MSDNIKDSFPEDLNALFIGNGQWRLITPFTYITKSGKEIIAPVNMITDGASIPRFAWMIVGSPWSGRYVKATIPHDFLYSKAEGSRKEADLIFYEAMGVLGVPRWKRWIMYQAVRIFAYFIWQQRKRRIAKEKEKK